jgi:hypothetical protein
VFYSYLKALGVDIKAEDITNRGKIDLTIILPETIYIIEFKVDEKEALDQIKEKKYYEKYEQAKPANEQLIFLIGIEFSTQERNVVNVDWERVGQ